MKVVPVSLISESSKYQLFAVYFPFYGLTFERHEYVKSFLLM